MAEQDAIEEGERVEVFVDHYGSESGRLESPFKTLRRLLRHHVTTRRNDVLGHPKKI